MQEIVLRVAAAFRHFFCLQLSDPNSYLSHFIICIFSRFALALGRKSKSLAS